MPKASPLQVPVTHLAVTGVIDQGCEFEGKLCFQGTVRISGTFRGEIFTPDTLVVGEGARVNAKIEAGTVIISGEVNWRRWARPPWASRRAPSCRPTLCRACS